MNWVIKRIWSPGQYFSRIQNHFVPYLKQFCWSSGCNMRGELWIKTRILLEWIRQLLYGLPLNRLTFYFWKMLHEETCLETVRLSLLLLLSVCISVYWAQPSHLGNKNTQIGMLCHWEKTYSPLPERNKVISRSSQKEMTSCRPCFLDPGLYLTEVYFWVWSRAHRRGVLQLSIPCS